MKPIDTGDRPPDSEPRDDALDAALRTLLATSAAAPADADAFTAAVMQRIARDRAGATDLAAAPAPVGDPPSTAPTLSAADALRHAQRARVRAQRRVRWTGASVLVGSAVGAAVTVALADSALAPVEGWLALALRPAAATAALAVLVTWAALRGGLR